MVTMKEEILVEVTMVVVETIMTGNYSGQQQSNYGPMKGGSLVEEAQAVPMVMAMGLEVEVVDMVAEGFKIKQKWLQFLAGERARSCQESCRLL